MTSESSFSITEKMVYLAFTVAEIHLGAVLYYMYETNLIFSFGFRWGDVPGILYAASDTMMVVRGPRYRKRKRLSIMGWWTNMYLLVNLEASC